MVSFPPVENKLITTEKMTGENTCMYVAGNRKQLEKPASKKLHNL